MLNHRLRSIYACTCACIASDNQVLLGVVLTCKFLPDIFPKRIIALLPMFTQGVLWLVASWHQICARLTWLEMGGFKNVVGLIVAGFSLHHLAPSPFACFFAIHNHSKVKPSGKKLKKFTKPPATRANYSIDIWLISSWCAPVTCAWLCLFSCGNYHRASPSMSFNHMQTI